LEQQSENPEPWLVFEPAPEPAGESGAKTTTVSTPDIEGDSAGQAELSEGVSTPAEHPAFVWPHDTGIQIIRATRSWIQYGTVGFAVICILIGALEGIFGR